MVDNYDYFHRVYRGLHNRSRDRVIIHIYDLSASNDSKALDIAKREFQTLQKLQKSPWVPFLRDSFHELPEYPGELYYFSLNDPVAPSVAERVKDPNWLLSDRLQTAILALKGLEELHHPEIPEVEPILHRNLTPNNLLIRSNGRPLFTDFKFAKLSNSTTVGLIDNFPEEQLPYLAPEIKRCGLGIADIRSDIYALAAVLKLLFVDNCEIEAILDQRTATNPESRPSLVELAQQLSAVKLNNIHQQTSLAVKFWDEEHIITFKDKQYRILNKIGHGGLGTTFKVEKIDPNSGTYLAKVIHNPEIGKLAIKAYAKLKTYQLKGLVKIIEYAEEWQENEVTVLMEWIEGDCLEFWQGCLELHIQELGLNYNEELIIQWLGDLCNALIQLHRVNLVHGDINPKNIIISGQQLTLIDYDCVIESGEIPSSRGTPEFSSPNVQTGETINYSDDLFALGATMFAVLFNRRPFDYDGVLNKNQGLNWTGIDKNQWSRVAAFLDKSTHPDINQRFPNGMIAYQFLYPEVEEVSPVLSENQVPWLLNILQSYPGSQRGNVETRGLDSDFAEKTYVETALEEVLLKEISQQQVTLVILCGNAGDGKTAFLQHLATRLGRNKPFSNDRYWDYINREGLHIKANLDGSASYQGQTANQILDQFFQPFQSGESPNQLVHLLAINSGKLLDWLEDYQTRCEKTPLIEQLEQALNAEETALASHIRFIDLNKRSLVGGIVQNSRDISTKFFDELIKKFLEGDNSDTWKSCLTCTAENRCTARRSQQLLISAEGPKILQKLTAALQAVHQRGEIHITARELRGTISYIFFGLDYCDDLHQKLDHIPESYWDRVFDPKSPNRQGELLQELTYLDPGLETHPLIDRQLLIEYPRQDLSSLRRRAYFEWSEAKITEVGMEKHALGLARGKHLQTFLQVGIMSESERMKVCHDLCQGISRLQDLPPLILERNNIALKISPRTPTETVFWVEKDSSQFRLSPEQFSGVKGLETLPSHLILSYQYQDGREEQLILGTELFHLLLELKNGYQISDSLSDDIFTNLSIFTQRLVEENNRQLYAWNPLEEDTIFTVKIDYIQNQQQLILERLNK